MHIIKWICGITLKERRTNEELRRLVGVEPITTFIRGGRLRWHGHAMRKGDEGWVKTCMEYRVEGGRPVGRPRRTWLESVEANMAELEIDKEYSAIGRALALTSSGWGFDPHFGKKSLVKI